MNLRRLHPRLAPEPASVDDSHTLAASESCLLQGASLAAVTALLIACGAPRHASREETRRPHWPTPAQAILEENEEGIVGGPEDDTGFEFEAEELPTEPPHLEIPEDADTVPSDRLARYLRVQRSRLAGVAPDGGLWVYARRGPSVQVHHLSAPGAAPEQVTARPDPVIQVAAVPGRRELLTIRTDPGGTEDYRLELLRPPASVLGVAGREGVRHGAFRWSPRGSHVAYTFNDRSEADMDLAVASADGFDAPLLSRAQRGSWVVLAWSDEEHVLLRHFRSVLDSSVHEIAIGDGTTRALGRPTGVATLDARRLSEYSYVVLTDRGGEFQRLFRFDGSSALPLTPARDGDVEAWALGPDRRRLAYVTNEDGVGSVRLLDLTSGEERPLEIPRGTLRGLRWLGREQLAFDVATAEHPARVATFDLETETLTWWTDASLPSQATTPEQVRIPSFDGLPIPTIVVTPPGEGPHPVLLWIHGGPEEQTRPSYDPIIQYLVNELSVAVVAPNVRGSRGYGRRYLGLDDGTRRADAIRDVGAVLEWVASDGRFDETRVGIHGASYGGYVVLASLAAFPSRLACGSDVVGISRFVSFLENTRPYRRALRRREYGDETDPEVRSYLEAVSPTTRAADITSPLLVAHGANDPRVPVQEALQVVDAVRANGTEVWLMVAPQEGHGFARRANRDTFHAVLEAFLRRHLIERAELDASTGEPVDGVVEGDGAPELSTDEPDVDDAGALDDSDGADPIQAETPEDGRPPVAPVDAVESPGTSSPEEGAADEEESTTAPPDVAHSMQADDT
ncbi:MAG: hypothetical protein SangKO_053400 [Sandaracinaceae bacterium]